jgi:hypothetical protein
MKSRKYLQSKRDRRSFGIATLNALMAVVLAIVGAYRWIPFLHWLTAGCIVVAVLNYISVFVLPDEHAGKDTIDYSRMIEKLAHMAKSLSDLSAFLEREQSRVAETESTINELQKKKAQLEPVVTTQRETVDAILAAHAARVRASTWKDRLVGFSIGVLSSLVAAFIWQVLTR